MKRPSSMQEFKAINPKLGIKSSLKETKATIALVILLWLSNDKKYIIEYSKSNGNEITISENCCDKLMKYLKKNVDIKDDSEEKIMNHIVANQLFHAQLEQLIVALELVWRIASIKFKNNKADSAERTGKKRFEKVMYYTNNIDLFDTLIESNKKYCQILYEWMQGKKTVEDTNLEKQLVRVINYLSDDVVLKMVDNNQDIFFNMTSVYEAITKKTDEIDINGDEEAKGALRIVKNVLGEGLNYYLSYKKNKVILSDDIDYDEFVYYKKRVKERQRISNIDIRLQNASNDEENINDISYSKNKIIFGAPGTGKSHKLEENSKCFADNMERVTFHPNYSYANFVGTYKPIMTKVETYDKLDTEKKKVLAILQDKSMSGQEKYDKLYDKFKDEGLTRLPLLLGIYTDDNFKTRKMDGSDAAGDNSVDLYTLFLDIALLLIKSEDADAARTALAGVFATLRVEPDYINFIEKMWDSFHYRAKEWILMIYELLWDYREDFHDNMLTILKKHCEDEDFNVSLYSNLLLENYSSDDSFKYIRNSKSYFDEIPNRGHKLFIKKNRPSPWINGYDCVMEQIELLSERLEVDGEHLEKRVADYCDKIPDTVQLIKLGRKWGGCRVVCENPNRSFLRVLYKDWYNHKFDWEEAELGRIVLSASEPYCLLITPQLWTYNNGYLLNPPESFISSSSVEQKKQIHDILFEGVDDTETVLAGGIIDYTHKEEIFGFMVSYFSIPGLPSKYAAYCYERNSRLLLQSRPDFSEQEHYNITLHHNGIESFQGSNIMCGFSKISLDEFHWHINITVNGMRLFNEGGQEIGRFEYYYGQRGNMGNRYISNQPLLQRWVVSKDAVSKARCIVGCPNNIKINHAFDSVIRKYED